MGTSRLRARPAFVLLRAAVLLRDRVELLARLGGVHERAELARFLIRRRRRRRRRGRGRSFGGFGFDFFRPFFSTRARRRLVLVRALAPVDLVLHLEEPRDAFQRLDVEAARLVLVVVAAAAAGLPFLPPRGRRRRRRRQLCVRVRPRRLPRGGRGAAKVRALVSQRQRPPLHLLGLAQIVQDDDHVAVVVVPAAAADRAQPRGAAGVFLRRRRERGAPRVRHRLTRPPSQHHLRVMVQVREHLPRGVLRRRRLDAARGRARGGDGSLGRRRRRLSPAVAEDAEAPRRAASEIVVGVGDEVDGFRERFIRRGLLRRRGRSALRAAREERQVRGLFLALRRRPRARGFEVLASQEPRPKFALRVVPYERMSGWSAEVGDRKRGTLGVEMPRQKSLRNGVHHANAVVWGPVYGTHLGHLRRHVVEKRASHRRPLREDPVHLLVRQRARHRVRAPVARALDVAVERVGDAGDLRGALLRDGGVEEVLSLRPELLLRDRASDPVVLRPVVVRGAALARCLPERRALALLHERRVQRRELGVRLQQRRASGERRRGVGSARETREIRRGRAPRGDDGEARLELVAQRVAIALEREREDHRGGFRFRRLRLRRRLRAGWVAAEDEPERRLRRAGFVPLRAIPYKRLSGWS
eukprot:31363-Pelagococcus_subviridis.AAC.12